MARPDLKSVSPRTYQAQTLPRWQHRQRPVRSTPRARRLNRAPTHHQVLPVELVLLILLLSSRPDLQTSAMHLISLLGVSAHA